jgi:hypothetical protein
MSAIELRQMSRFATWEHMPTFEVIGLSLEATPNFLPFWEDSSRVAQGASFRTR